MPVRSATEERHREIVKISAELFARRGYHATSVNDICEAVGLGKGALYYHIGSKEQLLYEISSRHVEEMVDFAERLIEDEDLSATEMLRLLSRRLMRTIADNLPELTVFFREVGAVNSPRFRELLDMRGRFEDVWVAIVKRGVARSEFREVDPVVLKGILGLHNYSYIWLRPHGRLSPEEISEHFVDMLLQGLASERLARVGA